MLHDIKVLWNERWTYYDLMKKKIDDGELSFWEELMNDPRSAGEYIFQKLQYWDSLPDFNELDIVMFIDSAIKAGKRNDYSAITILYKKLSDCPFYESCKAMNDAKAVLERYYYGKKKSCSVGDEIKWRTEL